MDTERTAVSFHAAATKRFSESIYHRLQVDRAKLDSNYNGEVHDVSFMEERLVDKKWAFVGNHTEFCDSDLEAHLEKFKHTFDSKEKELSKSQWCNDTCRVLLVDNGESDAAAPSVRIRAEAIPALIALASMDKVSFHIMPVFLTKGEEEHVHKDIHQPYESDALCALVARLGDAAIKLNSASLEKLAKEVNALSEIDPEEFLKTFIRGTDGQERGYLAAFHGVEADKLRHIIQIVKETHLQMEEPPCFVICVSGPAAKELAGTPGYETFTPPKI